MIKRLVVKFTRGLSLPRFEVRKGEVWEVRVDRLERAGFNLAGGFVFNEDYIVIGYK